MSNRNNSILYQEESQRVYEADELHTPFILSTPFPKIRCQIESYFGEWCYHFCINHSKFWCIGENYNKFDVLYKKYTAFLGTIRAPPSEVWFRLQISNKEVCEMADKEKFYIPIEGKLIEVEENIYIAYYKMGRRERYLEERDQANGVLSYDALDYDGMIGQEMFEDPEVSSLEDLELAKELIAQLHRCIDMLPRSERELIQAIYFDGLNDSEYARKSKVSQSGVSRRHKKILSKLRILMKFLTSF